MVQRGGLLGRFRRDHRGGVLAIMAIGGPVLVMIAAGVIEFTELMRCKALLQAAVDAAALSGARAVQIDQSPATVERSRAFADQSAGPARPTWTVTTQASFDASQGAVTVTQDATRASYFGRLLAANGLQVHVSATAISLSSKIPLCVLGIQAQGSGVLKLQKSSMMTAGECLVQSNSDIQAVDSASLRAGAVRAATAAKGTIAPAPLTDAPPISDPFAALVVAVPATCTDKDLEIQGTTTLNPGVHCGNMKVHGTGRLVLNPGEHYFKDAQIDVVGQGQIVGADVVLIFSGKFDMGFKGKATLSLEGRRSGPYAGFVIVTERAYTNAVEISTSSAHQLLGTLYLPNAQLRVAGDANKVADQSPWTIIVAKGIQVDGSAQLVINSRYFASSVPVPTAVANTTVRLSQ